jgi:hypothetical protein
MPLSGTQGMSIKSNGIPGIFSLFYPMDGLHATSKVVLVILVDFFGESPTPPRFIFMYCCNRGDTILSKPLRACLDNLILKWIEVVCGVLECNMN